MTYLEVAEKYGAIFVAGGHYVMSLSELREEDVCTVTFDSTAALAGFTNAIREQDKERITILEAKITAIREKCAALCEKEGEYSDEQDMALRCASRIRAEING